MKPYGWQKAPWESDRLIEVPSRTREKRRSDELVEEQLEAEVDDEPDQGELMFDCLVCHVMFTARASMCSEDVCMECAELFGYV